MSPKVFHVGSVAIYLLFPLVTQAQGDVPPVDPRRTSPASPPVPRPELLQVTPTEQRTDIREIVRNIGEREGIDFILDPRVRAAVGDEADSVSTYGGLLTILRVYGYAAVPTDGGTMIVPAPTVRSLATPIVQDDAADLPAAAVVTRTIDLEVEAAEFVPLLRPIVSPYGHLAAYGNRLIIVDHYDNVKRVAAVAAALTGEPARRR